MDSEDLKPFVEKIIASKSFGNSLTYANLLRYLVACTLTNDVPKEATIAADIFGKANFDPSQSTLVRVYVYNLRKKLGNYYAKEGKADEKIIRIPTGSYRVLISKKASSPSFLPKFTWSPGISVLLALLLLSVGFNIYWGLAHPQATLVNKSALWKGVIGSERSLMVVLGDLFIYSELDSTLGITRSIRDPFINSPEAFAEFTSRDLRPEISTAPISYSHLIQGSVQWIRNLTEVLFPQDKHYVIRTTSRFNPKELPDHDFFVIGMIKTWGIFDAYFKNSRFDYEREKDALIYQEGDDNPISYYRPQGNADSYHTDYGLLAKFPGPNRNVIFLFGGLWDTGATQSIKYFTDPVLLQELEAAMYSKFGKVPEYYEVLLEVSGVDRMELSSKIIALHSLEDLGGVWEVEP
ncbi:MAG: hypothetical protein AAGA86_05930 [Bacteroidota bacterium]